jgi:hypothetical protein
MATTTPNYGWSVPTSTDLVKDGATAIETLGDSADATVKALNPETTLVDISYRSSTSNTNTRLPIGSSGQVLAVSSGVPAWTTVAGGGKVLQVVTATSTTSTTNTTTTYADSNLTASITPTAATSKVLVLISQQAEAFASGSDTGMFIKILRGATTIWDPQRPTLYIRAGVTGDSEVLGVVNYSYLDSPATTSATTYKTQFKTAGGVSAKCQNASSPSSIILLEIGA